MAETINTTAPASDQPIHGLQTTSRDGPATGRRRPAPGASNMKVMKSFFLEHLFRSLGSSFSTITQAKGIVPAPVRSSGESAPFVKPANSSVGEQAGNGDRQREPVMPIVQRFQAVASRPRLHLIIDTQRLRAAATMP